MDCSFIGLFIQSTNCYLLGALTSKQKRFCNEYLVDHNAKRAMIAAGYSAKTAEVTGCKMLRVAKVKAYLVEKERKIEKKLEISAERTMLELARIAYGDARQFYDDKGNLIPIHKLSDDAAAAVAGMEVEEVFDKTRKGFQTGILKKIKRYDKLPALNMLAKHFKIFEEAPSAPVTINVSSLSAAELKALLAIKKKATC